jgi:transposase-like protein
VGQTIAHIAERLGITRNAWDKWRQRNPEFRRAADAARTQYQRNVADGLESADEYARILLDECQRDYAQPMHLRIRCSLWILNRDRKRWLPDDLPNPGSDSAADPAARHMANVEALLDLLNQHLPMPEPPPAEDPAQALIPIPLLASAPAAIQNPMLQP